MVDHNFGNKAFNGRELVSNLRTNNTGVLVAGIAGGLLQDSYIPQERIYGDINKFTRAIEVITDLIQKYEDRQMRFTSSELKPS